MNLRKNKLKLVSKSPASPVVSAQNGPDPVWEYDPYPRCREGIYDAFCTKAEIKYMPQFSAWKCILSFTLLSNELQVVGFYHLGTDREKPVIGHGSRYRHAWIIANGAVPKKRQKLSKSVFVGKFFHVRVGDTAKRLDGSDHFPEDVYSTVKEILERTVG